MGPQGIFKPAVVPEVPLSITTVPVVEGRDRPYEDEVGADGFSAIDTAVPMCNTVTTSAFGGPWSVKFRWCICTGQALGGTDRSGLCSLSATTLQR